MVDFFGIGSEFAENWRKYALKYSYSWGDIIELVPMFGCEDDERVGNKPITNLLRLESGE